jgi:hypothetical protein
LVYNESTRTSINIEDYISNDITKNVLSRQLGAVDLFELERSNGIETLTEFVLASFKSHFNGRDNEGVKKLDHITKDLKIPSRSGKNIANVLKVSFNTNFILRVKFCFIN